MTIEEAFGLSRSDSRTPQPFALSPLYIPTQTSPVVGGDGGINKAALSVSDRGLLVIVQAYLDMNINDLLEVFWGNSGAPDAVHVVGSGELNRDIALYVPRERIRDGWVDQVHCKLTRSNGNRDETMPLRLLVKTSLPGGEFDPEPGTPGHQNLAAPQLPQDIIDNGVSPEWAARGVQVSIAAYPLQPRPDMTVRDRIRLSWGGVFVEHVVQASELGQAITIEVDKATIELAGDNDRLVVEYEVVDEVGNHSVLFSPQTEVLVDASGARLAAPYVEEADANNVIDLEQLADADATVGVFAASSDFAVNDVIALTWAGRTAVGDPVDYAVEVTVLAVNRPVLIPVPNERVRQIAEGRAVVSYVLRKQDGTRRPSRAVTVSVIGAIIELQAPSVREAVGGHLDPGLAQATVDIQAYTGMDIGHQVILVWEGTKADGGTYYQEFPREVGSVGPITVVVPGSHIAVLNGGTLQVYYRVVTTSRTLESPRLDLEVGAAQIVLPAPTVLQAPGGVLNPIDAEGGATVRVNYTDMQTTDTILVTWAGVAGAGTPTIPSKPGSNGGTVDFPVPASAVGANIGKTVRVHYSVTRNGTPSHSGELSLTIQTIPAANLPTPAITQAVGSILNLASFQGDATVTATSWRFIAAGQRYWLQVRGTLASTGATHTITLATAQTVTAQWLEPWAAS